MKIRFDFVTNSSSSSFIAFNIRNKKLAEICRWYGIDVIRYDRNGVKGLFDVTVNRKGTPRVYGSITMWFTELLAHSDSYFSRAYKRDYSDIIRYLQKYNDDIDEATESSEIVALNITSDQDATDITIESRDNGVIKTYYVDENDWDFKKMGEPLWRVLEGLKTETFVPMIKQYAEDIGSVTESLDFWYTPPSASDKSRAASDSIVTKNIKEDRSQAVQIIEKAFEDNRIGYGVLIVLMTTLKAIPSDSLSLKDRLVLEDFLISSPMEELLGTRLKDVLELHKDDITKKLIDCIRYVKSDLSGFESKITEIRNTFVPEIKSLDSLLDRAMETIRKV